jgi:hypothetical protein
MVLLIGLKEGFIKILELGTERETRELKPSVQSHKL